MFNQISKSSRVGGCFSTKTDMAARERKPKNDATVPTPERPQPSQGKADDVPDEKKAAPSAQKKEASYYETSYAKRKAAESAELSGQNIREEFARRKARGSLDSHNGAPPRPAEELFQSPSPYTAATRRGGGG